VAHFDESGVRVGKRLHGLPVTSTDRATYYRIHDKRGEEAMTAMGILRHYLGTALQDSWAPYRKYRLSKDGLCNQHHERELQGMIDQVTHPGIMISSPISIPSKKREKGPSLDFAEDFRSRP